MDEKQVAPDRDNKEVINFDTSEKKFISTEDKEVALTDDGVLASIPIVKSLDVSRITDVERELRDHTTGTSLFQIKREVKKHLFRANEHHIVIHDPSRADVAATAKINNKTGECQVSHSKDGLTHVLQEKGAATVFFVNSRQLQWEPTSVGAEFGQFKLVDTKMQRPLALWRATDAVPDQVAKIDYFESMVDSEAEMLCLTAIFGIQEAIRVAAARDDDHGGGSRMFAGVDPGNSMGMGGMGGGGGML